MIVDFMKTSSRVEHHLQEKHSLTDLQYESIVTTVKAYKRCSRRGARILESNKLMLDALNRESSFSSG